MSVAATPRPPADPSRAALRRALRDLRGTHAWIGLLVAAMAIGLLTWPIFPADGDLWYHLASGRWIAQHHALPAGPIASVLPASPVWVDYYWLFQLLVYGLHALAGYPALAALRAALCLALVATVLVHLHRSRGGLHAWQATVLTLLLLFVLPRYAPLRPHQCSFLAIAVMALLLEHLPRAWPLLPIVGVLWMNLHGIEYPVLMLLLAAWGGPQLLDRRRRRPPRPATGERHLRWLALTALAPLATPFGLRLLRVPFTTMAVAGTAIAELAPFEPMHLGLGLVAGGITPASCLALLLLLGAAAAIDLGARGRLGAPHLLCALGGVALLLRSSRFAWEMALLLLPLLASWRPPALAASRSLRRAAATALTAVALLGLRHEFATGGRWPLDDADLPTGVTAFLARAGGGGVILGHPDLAGWLEWSLDDRYRIFGDLQTFLYGDRGLFLSSAPFADRQVLAAVVARWRPEWIAAPAAAPRFGALLGSVGGYAPVAFDWAEVLYARREGQQPLLAAWELTAVDPYAAGAVAAAPAMRARAIDELVRLRALVPESSAVAVALGRARLAAGAAEQARRLAEEAATRTPGRPEPWQLLGEALAALRRDRAALAAFTRAQERGGSAPAIARLRWASYMRIDQPARAHRALLPFASPLQGDTSWLDLWGLAESARACGDAADAARWLDYAWWKAPDPMARARIAAALVRLRAAPSRSP